MTMSKQIVIGAAMSVSFIALTGCGGKSPGPSPPGPATHKCSDFSKDAATCKAQSSHGCSWDDGKKDVCAATPGQAEYLAADQDTCQLWGGKLFHQCECVSKCPSIALDKVKWDDVVKEKWDQQVSWLAANTDGKDKNQPIKNKTNGQRCSGHVKNVRLAADGATRLLDLQGLFGVPKDDPCHGQSLTGVTMDQWDNKDGGLQVLLDAQVTKCSSTESCDVDNSDLIPKCFESKAKEPKGMCSDFNADFKNGSNKCPTRCTTQCTSYCKPNDAKGKKTDLSCTTNKADNGCQVMVNGQVKKATDKICKLTKAADAKGGECVGDYVNSTKIQ